MTFSSKTGPRSPSPPEPDEEIRRWHPFLQKFAGRDIRQYSTKDQSHLNGKRVIITGAAGWIGSALAKSLVQLDLDNLILIDSTEGALHEIDRTLFEMHRPAKHTAILASVSDSAAMAEMFEKHRPDTIFHAAAFKHVPLMEANPFAVVKNNALGTQILVEAATKYGCAQLVMISTDKAADPRSLMGASKRIAELTMLAPLPSPLVRKIVRLGNVLGSSGSVVPLFLSQIARGGPVTVSDPEVSRYFMTLTEAILALLFASSPGCPAGLFVPDLGNPIRILELATHLIAGQALSMNQPAEDIPIIFTSLRPGDKLEESLISARESYMDEQQALLRSVRTPIPRADDLAHGTAQLWQALRQRDLSYLLEAVRTLVPEYQPGPSLCEHLSPAHGAAVVA